jgi:hypothetical protein
MPIFSQKNLGKRMTQTASLKLIDVATDSKTRIESITDHEIARLINPFSPQIRCTQTKFLSFLLSEW